MLLLKGKEKSELLKQQYIDSKLQFFGHEKKFVAVLFFGKSNPSQVYVKLKEKYANDIWIDFLIFWQNSLHCSTNYSDLKPYQLQDYNDKHEVISLINILNNDNRCIWIICQLPLTEELKPYQTEICNTISPLKDIDGLWDKIQNRAFEWKIDFLPATPQAVISLWNAYNLWDFTWRDISVIGQSDIVWRPISRYLKIHWANLHTFDIHNSPKEISDITKHSEVIITCTGALHMINENFINKNWSQIIIDVWYWFLNWKSTWDVDFDTVYQHIKAISPVPGWVWPMTVASLFWNIFTLYKQRNIISNLIKW